MGHKTIEARGRLGAASRRHRDQPEIIDAARRDLAAAKLEDFITTVIDAAPPLTDDQRSRIITLLSPYASAAPPGHSPAPAVPPGECRERVEAGGPDAAA